MLINTWAKIAVSNLNMFPKLACNLNTKSSRNATIDKKVELCFVQLYQKFVTTSENRISATCGI